MCDRRQTNKPASSLLDHMTYMNEKLLIVALVGEPGAGRKTAATYLEAQGFAHLAFGTAVRLEVSEAWRIDARTLADPATLDRAVPALSAGMCSESGFLQWVADGGDALHAPRSAAWVLEHWRSWRNRNAPGCFERIGVRAIGRAQSCGVRRVVVSDLNRRAEAVALHELGAHVLRVHRPERASTAQAGHVVQQRHVIASGGDVLNDGSLHALAEAITEAVEGLTCAA